MQFTAAQIAQIINGNIEGDPKVAVSTFNKIEEAKSGELSFLSSSKYESYLYATTASVIILNNSFVLKQPVQATLIRVPDAYAAFVTLLQTYQQLATQQLKGVQQPAYLSENVELGENVYVGAFTFIGNHSKIGNNVKIYPNCYIGDNVKIGDNSIIHPGVKIYYGCEIKNNVVIHAGAVIGGDGFGFMPQANGSFQKVPQIGNVVIEEDVEIGCNTTIDRATIGSTVIKKGAKLDNLIQIAHNVEIGNSTVIAAQAGIAGSTKIGNGVMIGGQAGFAQHIQVADGVKIGGQAGVTHSIKTPNISVNDTPAFEYIKALKSQSVYKKLPDLKKELDDLKTVVQQINSNNT